MQAIPTNTPGVSNFGLVKVRSLEALAAEQREKEAAQNPQTDTVISGLSAYISGCWAKAKQAKIPIEQQMLKSLRQRNGIYDAEKLAAIRQMGGSDIYVLLTATKCRAAEAWIQDVLSPVVDRPWTIEPTPMAELPEDIQAELRAEVQEVFEQVRALAEQALQSPVPMEELRAEIREYTATRRDAILKEIQEEAKLRSERMAKKMDDQLAEGGWHKSLWEVVSDLVTLKASILKGPVVRRRTVKKWERGENSRWRVAATPALVPEFDRVSPFDLYPAPDSRHPDDGYLFERHHLSRADVLAMIGVPGYSEENIRAALREYGDNGRREWLSPDTERAQIEFGTSNALVDGNKIEALEFWGSVPGRLLLEWGMAGSNIDPDLEYEINAWQIGSYTIRALLNPDSLGRKPYSVDSYERVPGSFWGRGIPELMSDVQDVCNALARAIVNNAGLASGPQVEVNTDRVGSDSEEIWPWKIWTGTNQQMSEAPAVRFFQPTIITGPLLQVYEFFSAMAEDQTGIPRWAYGQTNIGGAGSTSSGLSMLMGNASRGVKMVISHIDDMIKGTTERLYDYNMVYDPDDGIKGDCNVVARGSSSLIAKEQKVMRRTEFLAQTANPIDVQLIGLKNRAKMLMQQAKELDLDIEADDELKQSLQEFAALIQQQAMQQAAMLQQGSADSPAIGRAPAAKPQVLDNAGNPAGGTDANIVQHQPGMTPGGMM